MQHLSLSKLTTKMALWHWILISLVLGSAAGALFGPSAQAIHPVGEMFIRAIQMLVMPIISLAITNAVISISHEGKIHHVLMKAMGLYGISMVAACIIALTVANFFQLGHGVALPKGNMDLATLPSFKESLIHLVPTNPFHALASGNIMQVLLFSTLLGLAIRAVGDEAKPVVHFIQAMTKVAFKMVGIVMQAAPIGVFCLMASLAGEFGVGLLWPLLEFVGVVYLACFLHCLLYYGGLISVFGKMSPVHFFRAISSALMLGFSTSSSSATLPESINVVENKLGVSKKLSTLLLTFGTSFNLNGIAIYLSIATVFAANVYGIHLTLMHHITIIVTVVMTAAGAAGVPGTGLVIMGSVMTAVGVPLGLLPIIASVDRLNDMAQTTTNIAGDISACYLIANSECGESEESASAEVVGALPR